MKHANVRFSGLAALVLAESKKLLKSVRHHQPNLKMQCNNSNNNPDEEPVLGVYFDGTWDGANSESGNPSDENDMRPGSDGLPKKNSSRSSYQGIHNPSSSYNATSSTPSASQAPQQPSQPSATNAWTASQPPTQAVPTPA